ncbi:MAG: hypothetical protein RLZ95_268 [Bacteroidota bacterium]|jgi:type I site-specific restriction-modification system R (restriction) subunit
MISLHYPSYPFKIRANEEASRDGQVKDQIFDPFRKKWVALTPEEWVRQNILQYLVQIKHYPASLIAVEKSIQLGELTKRFDIVVYKNDAPWMIIECKEAKETISDKTISQLFQYQQVLAAEILVASNGHETVGAEIKSGKLQALQNFPEYV